MSINILAIDHGGRGAFALKMVLSKGYYYHIERMPKLSTIKGQKQLLKLLEDFKQVSGYYTTGSHSLCAFIEKAHLIPGKFLGHGGFMMNFGIMLMALCVSDISYQIISAKDWKADILRGTSKDKEASIEYVMRRHPDVDLMPGRIQNPHDGIADAVCIADYGDKLVNGKQILYKSKRKRRRRKK